MYVCEKGQVPIKKVLSNSKKLTLIGLTVLTGEPVMCILITEGEGSNPSIETGTDI